MLESCNFRIIGFTGTQDGMTRKQRWAFSQLMHGHEGDMFHHGDCIGADADAHKRARREGMRVMEG